ncbi:MAG TPA: T9SS type A sorting domain-containing protein [Flavobacteriales bacterium]|nr:T9SS type A sorting domain-containing protein [Flavobacteriales bacterium]
MVLFLGDNAYDSGTDLEYQGAIFENMYEDMLQKTVSWSCRGNHEQVGINGVIPYYDIFTFPENGEAGGIPSNSEAYYSFDYGNIHFISLDSYGSNRSVGGPMYLWAEADLQNTDSDWIIAFWHHPPYTKGSHNSDTEIELIQMRSNFLPLFEDYGVDLVLSGHSHSYERSYLLNGHYGNSNTFNINTMALDAGSGQQDVDSAYEKTITGNDAGKGAVYLTAGSSGKISSSGSLDHPAMHTSLRNILGSCILEAFGDTLDFIFLDNNGVVEDYFTIVKESNLNYCQSYATQSNSFWIDSISFGDINHKSGNDGGYGDHTDVSTPLTDGMDITLKPGFVVGQAQEELFWNVWIDFNQDGDFEDNGELAFQEEQRPFLRGDANGDGNLDIADMMYIYSFLFQGGGNFTNPDAADVNDDGEINITDGVYLANYLFLGSVPTLPEPFETPGLDPTEDNLGGGSSGTINVPVDAHEGQTRMRIQAKVGEWPSNACDTFNSGEVEDYTVEVLILGQDKLAGGLEPDFTEEEESTSITNTEEYFEKELVISTYPNPSDAIVTLAVEGGSMNKFSYKVIDLVGQLVEQEMDVNGQSARIDVSQLPKGIYLVIVQSGNQQKTQKIMVK